VADARPAISIAPGTRGLGAGVYNHVEANPICYLAIHFERVSVNSPAKL